MCGFLGIIGNSDNHLLNKCARTLIHRGPDSNGYYSNDNISLYHSRLSIQDLTVNAHQPMISPDGNFILLYNGEIYNHWELRKNLEYKYTFKSTSDTETLLYGLIEHGEGFLHKLNGIFSLALYNKTTYELFIARDPLGVKPLYYYHKNNYFAFSSEIKSFKEFPDLDKSISKESLVNYLTLLYSPGELCPLNKVKKLLPGHFIRINTQNPSEVVIKKYIDLPVFNKSNAYISENQLEKKLEEKLLGAVERQMISNVPVGFFLSGGLDSSTLIALAKKINPNKNFQCFTINQDTGKKIEGFQNDLQYARIVAKYLNVDLEEIKIGSEILQNFDHMIYHLDEPISDPAALHTYIISKKAKEMGYKVLISGTGGDEVFSGYRRHQAIHLEKYYPYIPNFLFDVINSSLSLFKANHPIRRRGEKLLKYSKADKFDRIISYFFWLDPLLAKDLFTPRYQEILNSYKPENYFSNLNSQLPKDWDDINRMLYLEMNSYLPDNNLTYTDKMGMAAGVEIRVPFLDKEIVEFSMQLPTELKMRGTTTKYLLRKVMEKHLPKEIIHRPKTGFGAPVRSWIKNDLVEKINTELSYERISKRGIFNPDKVWELIKDNKDGKIDASYSIWALLAIESWMKQFIDE